MMQKQQTWRSRKYLDAAKDQYCVRCFADDGTIVAAHYTGLRQHIYGKGTRIKGSDILTADLCRDCHIYFDNPDERKSIRRSEEFLNCIAITLMRRLEQGVLKA